MAGRKSSGPRNNKGATTKAAEKKERARRAAEASKDLSWAGEGSQKRIRRGGEHAERAMLKSLARDDMPAQLNKQKELIAGLLKLVKESNASVDKATGEIVELREDKAKLCHELDLLKEEIAGWEKLREKSSASVKMLTAVIGELRDDMAKLRTENVAAVKQHHADVKEIIHARLEKSRAMEAMKKMADERREEMKVMEAMKKQLELRAQQPFMK
jgi:hypothetical protein